MSGRRKRGARSNPDRSKDPSDPAWIASRMRVVGSRKLSPDTLKLLMKMFMDYLDRKDAES